MGMVLRATCLIHHAVYVPGGGSECYMLEEGSVTCWGMVVVCVWLSSIKLEPFICIVYHQKKKEVMEVQKILHMIPGEGETSYALNSQVQKAVISKAKSYVQGTVADLYQKTLPKCFTIADLGCSSGPNSLQVIQEIIDTVHSISQNLDCKSPEFQVILNDLPGNDFNTIFKSIPIFQDKLKKEKGDEFGTCFVSGTPGSFHGRLFPSNTLDFVHSSYSLHFLSKIPSGIENNKGHIYISKASPPNVAKAYLMQFQNDFTTFLRSRSQEVVPEGRMVITIIGRRSLDPCPEERREFLAMSLRDLVLKGHIEEAKLDSFNWPQYYPCAEEVSSLIQEEGSFHEDVLDVFDVAWDANIDLPNKDVGFTCGQYMSNIVRAVIGPAIIRHFGEQIMETLFTRYGIHVDEYLLTEKVTLTNLVMCLRRK